MPSGKVNVSQTFYEIMDENHRINAAINSNTNIPVTILESVFLPNSIFVSSSDCIIYNCFIGILNVLCNFETSEQCLNKLEKYLIQL